jgi:energy-coupling factor transporter ATP-binding protein EcfA2
MAIFQRLNRERGLTVIFVTHEADIAYHTRRIVQLRDGLITLDEPVPDDRFHDAELGVGNGVSGIGYQVSAGSRHPTPDTRDRERSEPRYPTPDTRHRGRRPPASAASV